MLKVYEIKELFERINSCSGIACFGVGERFRKICADEANVDILRKIKYLADNSEDKHHKKYDVLGREVEVFNVQEIAELVDDNTVILITCRDYEAILNQLENTERISGLDIICYTHIYGALYDEQIMNKEIPENIKLSDVPLIPKKIHYCWFGGKPIPEKYLKWMESWKKYCPDYEIIEWNESNYDISKNKYMKQAYANKKWGFVPDYARLDIIYNHGGLYLDTDVELIKNLDHLLYQKAFAGFETGYNVALGLGFGAEKGTSIIKEMMENYDQLEFINNDGTMNMVASPIYQTRFLMKKGLVRNGEYQIVDDMTIYPEKMFCAKSAESRRVLIKPYTCSIHHYDASWADDNVRRINMRVEKDIDLFSQD